MKKTIVLLSMSLLLLFSCTPEANSTDNIEESFNSVNSEDSKKINSDNTFDNVSSDISDQIVTSDINNIVHEFYERYKTYVKIQRAQLDYKEFNNPDIDIYNEYCIVDDEHFTSIESIHKFTFTVFSTEKAKEKLDLLFNEQSAIGTYDPPLYFEKDGILYMIKSESHTIYVGLWNIEEAESEMQEDGSIIVKVPVYELGNFIHHFTLINNGENWVIKSDEVIN